MLYFLSFKVLWSIGDWVLNKGAVWNQFTRCVQGHSKVGTAQDYYCTKETSKAIFHLPFSAI